LALPAIGILAPPIRITPTPTPTASTPTSTTKLTLLLELALRLALPLSRRTILAEVTLSLALIPLWLLLRRWAFALRLRKSLLPHLVAWLLPHWLADRLLARRGFGLWRRLGRLDLWLWLGRCFAGGRFCRLATRGWTLGLGLFADRV
jgi:hypothetical protein